MSMSLFKKFVPGRRPSASDEAKSKVQGLSAAELMSLIHASTLQPDRAAAVAALSDIDDLALQVPADDFATLLSVVEGSLEDVDTMKMVTDIITSQTDETSKTVPKGVQDAVLSATMDAQLFLQLLVRGNFWTKYNSVQILKRQLEYDPMTLQKQILSAQGVSALVDILGDNSNHGVLRNEGLVLMEALTATNQEVQNILAFENGFESLFRIAKEEGGLQGDIIVEDCLRVVHNILRENAKTQKLFREMGYLASLAPLISFYDRSVAVPPQVNSIMRAALGVVRALMEGVEQAPEEGPAMSTAMCQNKVLHGVATLAIAQDVEVNTNVEALRTLHALVKGHRSCAEQLLSVSAQREHNASVGAVWAILRMALTDTDAARQVSALNVIASQLDASGEPVAMHLVTHFSPVSATASQGVHCGYVLAANLMAAATQAATPRTLYNAGTVFALCVGFPSVVELLQSVVWDGGLPFFVAYGRHCMNAIQTFKDDDPTVSALFRGMFNILRGSKSSIGVVLGDTAVPQFLADWTSYEGGSIHSRYLCASLLGQMCSLCPLELPPNVTVTRKQLLELVNVRLGSKLYGELNSQVAFSNEWRSAPQSTALSPEPAVYDAQYMQMLRGLGAEVMQQREGQKRTAAEEHQAEALEPFQQMIRQQDQELHASKQQVKELDAKNTAQLTELCLLRAEADELRAQMAAVAEREASIIAEWQQKLDRKDQELAEVTESLSQLETRVQAHGQRAEVSQLEEKLAASLVEREELYTFIHSLHKERKCLRRFL